MSALKDITVDPRELFDVNIKEDDSYVEVQRDNLLAVGRRFPKLVDSCSSIFLNCIALEIVERGHFPLPDRLFDIFMANLVTAIDLLEKANEESIV